MQLRAGCKCAVFRILLHHSSLPHKENCGGIVKHRYCTRIHTCTASRLRPYAHKKISDDQMRRGRKSDINCDSSEQFRRRPAALEILKIIDTVIFAFISSRRSALQPVMSNNSLCLAAALSRPQPLCAALHVSPQLVPLPPVGLPYRDRGEPTMSSQLWGNGPLPARTCTGAKAKMPLTMRLNLSPSNASRAEQDGGCLGRQAPLVCKYSSSSARKVIAKDERVGLFIEIRAWPR